MVFNKSKQARKAWWKTLSPAEQSEHIKKWQYKKEKRKERGVEKMGCVLCHDSKSIKVRKWDKEFSYLICSSCIKRTKGVKHPKGIAGFKQFKEENHAG